MRIAVVEDEARLARSLKEGFEMEEHSVDVFPTGALALSTLSHSGRLYDLILLDLMLPDTDGARVCSHLRTSGVEAPILVLTARDSTEDKVDLFDRGADDFLSKPFEFEELYARARALTRRTQDHAWSTTIGGLTIEPKTREVRKGAKVVPFTPREYELFAYLVQERGRVVPREELLTRLWPEESPNTNVLDVHIRNVRKKLASVHEKDCIHTIHGVGYSIA